MEHFIVVMLLLRIRNIHYFDEVFLLVVCCTLKGINEMKPCVEADCSTAVEIYSNKRTYPINQTGKSFGLKLREQERECTYAPSETIEMVSLYDNLITLKYRLQIYLKSFIGTLVDILV